MMRSVIIIGDSGEVILEKCWGGASSTSSSSRIYSAIRKHMQSLHHKDQTSTSYGSLSPSLSSSTWLATSPSASVLVLPQCYVIIQPMQGASLAITTTREMSPLLAIDLLSSLHRLLLDYLPSPPSLHPHSLSLSEDSVKDHFSTVLSVLEEAMVAGLPLSLEPCILKTILPTPSLLNSVVTSLTGTVGGAPPPPSSFSSPSFSSLPVQRLGAFLHSSFTPSHSSSRSPATSTNSQPLRKPAWPSSSISSNVIAAASASAAGVSLSSPLSPGSLPPWRAPEGGHASPSLFHEVQLELREQLDVTVGPSGHVDRCSVFGEIFATCRLPGMPHLSLSFIDHSLLSSLSFHPCVHAREWQSDRVLSFVPPQGEFRLACYSVASIPHIPIYVKPRLGLANGTARLHVLVGSRPPTPTPSSTATSSSVALSKVIEDVQVSLSLPSAVSTCEFKATIGSVYFDVVSKTCVWSIGRLTRDQLPCLSATLHLPRLPPSFLARPLISLSFRMPGTALSGLRFDRLQLRSLASNQGGGGGIGGGLGGRTSGGDTASAQPVMTVKSVTVGGRFEVRT